MSIARSIAWLVLGLLLTTTSAIPDYQYATENCTARQSIGQAIYCCSGACLDGTRIDSSGLCVSFNDFCNDAKPASCGYNQVMNYNGYCNYDPQLGGCYLGDYCTWQQTCYASSCCDCPAGYVSLATECGNSGPRQGPCFGCTSADETIAFNNVSQSLFCNGTAFNNRACQFEKDFAHWVNVADLFSTWAGAFCPGGSAPSRWINLLEDGINTINFWSNSTPDARLGIDGTGISLASQAVATLSSWAVDVEDITAAVAGSEIIADLAATYLAACSANTVLNVALTTISNLLPLIQNEVCSGSSTTPITRRLTPELPEEPHRARPRLDTLARSTLYNPCAEFLATIPSNWSSVWTLQDSCYIMEGYSADDTLSQDLWNGTNATQVFCTDFQNSGNSSSLRAFSTMLDAMQMFAPYCDNSTIIAANSSSSLVSSTPSSRRLTSSTSNSVVTTVSPTLSSSKSSSTLTSSSTVKTTSSTSTSSSKATSSSSSQSSSKASTLTTSTSSTLSSATKTSSTSQSTSSLNSKSSSVQTTKSTLISSSSSSSASASSSLKASTNGHCGGTTGLTCKGNPGGECCSQHGYCGDTSDYCGAGCDASAGICWSSSSSFSSSSSPASSHSPTASFSSSSSRSTLTTSTATSAKSSTKSSFSTSTSASIKSSTSNSVSKPSSSSTKTSIKTSTTSAKTTTVHPASSSSSSSSSSVAASTSLKASTNGHCGGTTGLTCKGNPGGECCSQYGFCGDTADYCGQGCDASAGICWSSSSSSSSAVRTSSTKKT